jgi:hypothetical protein
MITTGSSKNKGEKEDIRRKGTAVIVVKRKTFRKREFHAPL